MHDQASAYNARFSLHIPQNVEVVTVSLAEVEPCRTIVDDEASVRPKRTFLEANEDRKRPTPVLRTCRAPVKEMMNTKTMMV